MLHESSDQKASGCDEQENAEPFGDGLLLEEIPESECKQDEHRSKRPPKKGFFGEWFESAFGFLLHAFQERLNHHPGEDIVEQCFDVGWLLACCEVVPADLDFGEGFAFGIWLARDDNPRQKEPDRSEQGTSGCQPEPKSCHCVVPYCELVEIRCICLFGCSIW